jgi:hypothetical protein
MLLEMVPFCSQTHTSRMTHPLHVEIILAKLNFESELVKFMGFFHLLY